MRESLASKPGRRHAGVEVVQIGAPGLYCMDDPSVMAFAKAFHMALGARKQDILAQGVVGIMADAASQLDESMNIRTLNGDKIEGGNAADVRPGAGPYTGEDQQPVA